MLFRVFLSQIFITRCHHLLLSGFVWNNTSVILPPLLHYRCFCDIIIFFLQGSCGIVQVSSVSSSSSYGCLLCIVIIFFILSLSSFISVSHYTNCWVYCYLLARSSLFFFYLPLLATVAKVLSLASFEICIYCIFIIMNKHVVGWEKTRTQLKFVHAKNKKCMYISIKTRAKLCDSDIRITWVHISRLPPAAPRQWQMEMHLVH